MKCRSSCPRCYFNRVCNANYEKHAGFDPAYSPTIIDPRHYLEQTHGKKEPLGLETVNLLLPPADPPAPSPAATPPPLPKLAAGEADAFQARYPFLHAYLVVGPREGRRATMMFFIDDGRWKACLHDRSNSRSAWASGDTWTECLTSLDRRIGDETVEWRRSWKTGG